MGKEKILSYLRFFLVQAFIGLIVCVFLPSLFFLYDSFAQSLRVEQVIGLMASSLLLFSSLITLHFLRRFPTAIATSYILSISFFWFVVILISIKILGVSYSLGHYFLSGALLLLYLFLIDNVTQNLESHTFAYIPVGRARDMPEQIKTVDWLKLESPALQKIVKGIVTDLHSDDLNGEWEHFLAEQTLKRVPVYHHRNIRESFTGRVRITHLYENELASLLPSENYIFLKRIIGLLLIIFSLPVTLPIMLITALFIKLESPGSILFTQKRVGQGGKEFVIYKFRSMCANSEAQGAKMASANDMRVTRVGKFIRKTRIDELPQFFNVLKGDMSLIGPRPEQKVFVEQFEKTIPFYNYRHIVKPGITGWAQVTQGYAGNEDETRIKVEYDFFYIKYFSFSLDLLIFFKTVRTMLTGFGAR